MTIELGITDDVTNEWEKYVLFLQKAGMRLQHEDNVLVWYSNKDNGNLIAKNSYVSFTNDWVMTQPHRW